MRVSTAVTLALTALLATSLLGAVTAAAPAAPAEPEPEPTLADRPAPTSAPSATEPSHPAAIDVENATLEPAEPRQVIRINVTDSGDTRWTIESRFLVTDDEDEELFYEYAEALASGERTVAYDSQLFEENAELASAATGREMAIEDAGWAEPRLEEPNNESDLEEETRIGVVADTFTWTNFATATDGEIHFGDAFELPNGDGTWLSTLADDQRLVIESPPNYGLSPETPSPLSWDGPREFDDGELEIVFIRGGGTTAATSFGSWWIVAGVAGLVLGAGGYVGYRYVRQRYDAVLPIGLGSSDEGASDRPESNADSPSTAETSSGSTAQSTATDESGTQIAYDEDVDLELLSDEERVLRLLRQNGGRMKQANIVKETGWSNAKVSQLLSKMDDDGEIEKLRIGRENLITLPEVDPTEID